MKQQNAIPKVNGEFSRFFREASEEEQDRLWMRVLARAAADQRAVIEKAGLWDSSCESKNGGE